MDENDRIAGPSLLVIQADAIVGGEVGHCGTVLIEADAAILRAVPQPRQAMSALNRRRSSCVSLTSREEKEMQSDRQARVSERAHQIWVEEGCPDGKHDEHWHRA